MAIEVSLNTPLGDALISAIQPKIAEVGWGSGGTDDQNLAEYIVLMLGNNQTQEQIASELSSDLLNLGPDDPSTLEFTKWLFQHVEVLNRQVNGGGDATTEAPQEGASTEMDTDMASVDASEPSMYDPFTAPPRACSILTCDSPTGPRSMRNGNNRGGRDKRMFGQMNKAMDRSADGALHRVRGYGNERINTHGRTPPTGPRSARGGMGRNNQRAANIQAGLAGMGPGGPQMQWMMQPGQPNPADLMNMFQQIQELGQQLGMPVPGQMQGHGGYGNHQRGGKPNRGHDRNNFRRNQNRDNRHDGNKGAEGEGEGEDVEMGGAKREPPNPDDTICKYNLRCTNKDCKFAHQSPAAPPGASVDVKDNCSFGAACKNRKCVARHPSPATKLAHQSEQDCKFFPNCHNPQCPFKHPSMPLCRNGADCTTENCKFTHVKTKCRFKPCLNPNCAFAHEEGQQGGFKDKVWTAQSEEEHVSERKFVDEAAGEELIKPDEDAMRQDSEVIV